MLGASIVRRALVRHGEFGLSRKVWSAATPCKLPTDFGVHIIYLMQQFDSCACRLGTPSEHDVPSHCGA